MIHVLRPRSGTHHGKAAAAGLRGLYEHSRADEIVFSQP